jgi:hypothetical protein
VPGGHGGGHCAFRFQAHRVRHRSRGSAHRRIRSSSGSKFSNVSKELLSLCLDTDGDQVCDTREFLFDRDLADYFWSYDNSGLKVAQLRFYEVPTNVGTMP